MAICAALVTLRWLSAASMSSHPPVSALVTPVGSISSAMTRRI
jgi:hypothetical protein